MYLAIDPTECIKNQILAKIDKKQWHDPTQIPDCIWVEQEFEWDKNFNMDPETIAWKDIRNKIESLSVVNRPLESENSSDNNNYVPENVQMFSSVSDSDWSGEDFKVSLILSRNLDSDTPENFTCPEDNDGLIITSELNWWSEK